MVTWRSCMASSNALCTFAGARLISSANIKLAKIGPFFTSNFSFLTLYTIVPITSAGSKSGVNWMRLNLASISDDKVLIANVFAKPGTPSKSTWPFANNAINNESTKCFWPTMVWSIPRVIKLTNPLLLEIKSFNSLILTDSLITFVYFIWFYTICVVITLISLN